MTRRDVSRRELLRNGSVLTGGLWLSAQVPFPLAARAAAESSAPAVLSAAEWKTLEAITARVIPTDAQPGAREAGCTNFIDKALANEEAAMRPLYALGLAGVEAVSETKHQLAFTALSAEQQDALLESIERGDAKGWPDGSLPSPSFFELARVHTIIGFLADPKYGGNRDFAGWRVTGYPGPRHRRGGYRKEQVTGAAKVRTVWNSEQ